MRDTNIDNLLIAFSYDISTDKELLRKMYKFQQKMEGDFIMVACDNPNIIKNVFYIEPEKFENTIRFIRYKPEQKNPFITVVKDENSEKAPGFFNKGKFGWHYRFDGPLKIRYLREFVNDCLTKESFQPYEESSYKLYKQSMLLSGFDYKNVALDGNKHVVVEFYKQHCPGCAVLEPIYEKFAEEVLKVQNFWRKVESGDFQYSITDDNVVNKYHLKKPDMWMDLLVCRFNTLNDNPYLKVHETPLINFYNRNGGGNELPVKIDLIGDKISLNDSERVIWHLFKVIDYQFVQQHKQNK